MLRATVDNPYDDYVERFDSHFLIESERQRELVSDVSQLQACIQKECKDADHLCRRIQSHYEEQLKPLVAQLITTEVDEFYKDTFKIKEDEAALSSVLLAHFYNAVAKYRAKYPKEKIELERSVITVLGTLEIINSILNKVKNPNILLKLFKMSDVPFLKLRKNQNKKNEFYFEEKEMMQLRKNKRETPEDKLKARQMIRNIEPVFKDFESKSASFNLLCDALIKKIKETACGRAKIFLQESTKLSDELTQLSQTEINQSFPPCKMRSIQDAFENVVASLQKNMKASLTLAASRAHEIAEEHSVGLYLEMCSLERKEDLPSVFYQKLKKREDKIKKNKEELSTLKMNTEKEVDQYKKTLQALSQACCVADRILEAAAASQAFFAQSYQLQQALNGSSQAFLKIMQETLKQDCAVEGLSDRIIQAFLNVVPSGRGAIFLAGLGISPASQAPANRLS